MQPKAQQKSIVVKRIKIGDFKSASLKQLIT
jgi:hypothetical protein